MTDHDGACHCVLHEPPANSDWDPSIRKLAADVVRHGWGVIGIKADDRRPGWAFTVGLWHTFRSPEVAMFGVEVDDMQLCLNDVGAQIRAGDRLGPEELRGGILEDTAVTFRPVHHDWYRQYFTHALWFTQRAPLPVVQLVWPDQKGRFPWETDCDPRCRYQQPQLWLARNKHPIGLWTRAAPTKSWPFPLQPDAMVLTTKRIALQGRAIVYVVHDEDGDWQFLDGDDVTGSDAVSMHLDEVVGAQPHIAAVGNLERGWEAWQSPPDGEWVRRQLSSDD